jgi:hypothetical protein
MMKTLPSRLLKGPVLIGFATAFDSASGDSETEYPYPIVTPSAVGPILLPFCCPHCGADCGALVDPERRLNYYDKLRKFSWCPSAACRKRFFVDRGGMPLPRDLYAGSKVAPSKVARDGKEEIQAGETRRPSLSGYDVEEEVRSLEMLGAL